tara:strand:- start:538 stop:903 length:366 start_codon:yes stop_codon:yes gene_type:complete
MTHKKNKDKAHVHMKDGEVYVTIDGEVLSNKEASEFLSKDIKQREFEEKFGKQPEKVDTIDSYWAIADDMRVRKEAGEFSTYKDAYDWVAKHMTQNGKTIKAESLKNEWHKAKIKGLVGLD